MTDEQMRASIVAAIQDDATMIKLMKAVIQFNIVNVETPRLLVLMTILGLPRDEQ